MIVNAHAHLGKDVVFDEECTEEELLGSHARYGVSASIVQPFVGRPYPADTAAAHDRIAALTKSYPGSFFGMASIQPHFTREDYRREAFRCVRELGFVGIKITPVAHAADPQSEDCRFVFETARELDVPVMVHTGSGAPFSDPARLFGLAEAFPDVPLVLAHAGTDAYFTQALYLAERWENVYLEPSWLSILCLRTALRRVGAGKIMFSADHTVNVPVERAKYETLLADKPQELEQVYWRTAAAVFRLPLTEEEA